MSDWQTQAQMFKRIDRADGRTIMLFVSDADHWMVAALETATAKFKESGAEILDDHNHKVVGSYKTLREALDAADSFAEAWLRDWKSTRSEKCDCEEIGLQKASRRRRKPTPIVGVGSGVLKK